MEPLEHRSLLAADIEVRGIVFFDQDQSGSRGENETPLANWLVFVDLNDNLTYDADDAGATTNPDGTYSIIFSSPGAYRVYAETPQGYRITSPADGSYLIAVDAGDLRTGLDFGLAFQDSTMFAKLSGSIWHDVDHNGNRSAQEPGLQGWTIYLDLNQNSLFDGDEPWTYSEADGSYLFDSLPPQTYTVREVVPTGWQISSPSIGQHVITLAEGDSVTNRDFGNYLAETGEIRGKKWRDDDGDGVYDPTEMTLANWQIYLDDNFNGVRDNNELSTVTDSNGNYLLSGVAPGPHVLAEAMSPVWEQQFPGIVPGFVPRPLVEIPFTQSVLAAQAAFVAMPDIDADLRPDLIAFDKARGTVSFMGNEGAGRFAAPKEIRVGQDVQIVLPGDIDGDKDIDFVTLANAVGDDQLPRIRIDSRINDGTRNFPIRETFQILGKFDFATLTDVDKDGDLDVIVSRFLSDSPRTTSFAVLSNNGQGRFTESDSRILTESSSGTLIARDFTGDRLVDLLGVDAAANEIAFRKNLGPGGFAAAIRIAVGMNPVFAMAGDFNGDGFLDIVVLNRGSHDVSVILNNRDGTFGTESRFGSSSLSSPSSGVMGDFDGNGSLDLAVTDSAGNSLVTFFNDGTGAFSGATSYATDLGPVSVVTGDFNGDGNLDLATAASGSKTISIFTNSGTGQFSSSGSYVVDGVPTNVVTGYFDGGTSLDIGVATEAGSFWEFLNNGDGTFASGSPSERDRKNYSIATGDINGDGYTDLLSAIDATHIISIWTNSGTGYFHEASSFDVGQRPHFVSLADLDKDGDLDMTVAFVDSDKVGIYKNNGSGLFSLSGEIDSVGPPVDIKPGDLDSDGDLDLVISTESDVGTFRNAGDGSFSGSMGSTSISGGGSVATGDLNGDGLTDILTSLLGTSIGAIYNNAAPAYRHRVEVTPGSVSADLDFGNQKLSWMNPLSALDVDGDLVVAPIDALIIINHLNSLGSGIATNLLPFAKPFLDTSGDDYISALDALLVINELNARTLQNNSGEGEGSFESTVVTVGSATNLPSVESDVASRAFVISEALITNIVSLDTTEVSQSSLPQSNSLTTPKTQLATVLASSPSTGGAISIDDENRVANSQTAGELLDNLDQLLDSLAEDIASAWR